MSEQMVVLVSIPTDLSDVMSQYSTTMSPFVSPRMSTATSWNGFSHFIQFVLSIFINPFYKIFKQISIGQFSLNVYQFIIPQAKWASEASKCSEWNGRKFTKKKILARPHRGRGLSSVRPSVRPSVRSSVRPSVHLSTLLCWITFEPVELCCILPTTL
jgi:hypothetical protein